MSASRVPEQSAFSTLTEACALLADWRDDYNRVRAHSALATRTPGEFRTAAMALAAITAVGEKFNLGLSTRDRREGVTRFSPLGFGSAL